MKISKVSYIPFRLPFAGTFGTARSSLKQREGFILRLETDSGLVGLGEASPLPEFGGGTVADVLRWLEEWSPEIMGQDAATVFDRVQVSGPGASAFLCGLDMALCDVMAEAEGRRIAEWLTTGPVKESVPVNATIGAPDNMVAAIQAQSAIAEGFECVKLKVGMAKTVQEEVARVRAVREAIGPEARLRLDANGAWTVEQAISTLHNLKAFGIELVEQPVAAIDLAGMAQVRKAISIPIAADEAVTSIETARAVIAAGAADILVIKPMMVGGLRAGRKIIQMAEIAGLKAFVTTTIDSGIGIAAALHLAATLPEPGLACGLATASLLEGSLVKELPLVRNGRMFLPDRPGLSVEL